MSHCSMKLAIILSLGIPLGTPRVSRTVDFGPPTTYPVGTSLLSGNGNGTFLGLGGGQFRAKFRGLYNQEIIRKCSRQERGVGGSSRPSLAARESPENGSQEPGNALACLGNSAGVGRSSRGQLGFESTENEQFRDSFAHV